MQSSKAVSGSVTDPEGEGPSFPKTSRLARHFQQHLELPRGSALQRTRGLLQREMSGVTPVTTSQLSTFARKVSSVSTSATPSGRSQ